jgi:alpha-1,3-mannosyltransferase
MKILHICRQYWPSVGGVERFVSDLTTRLAARGHTVEIATLNRVWNKPDRLPAYELVDGVPVHRLPFVGGALFFLAPAVYSLLSRFDLIHVHNTDFFLDFIAATRDLHRKPFVVSTHGGFFHTPSYNAIKRVYFAAVTHGGLKAASTVVPNSAADERRFGPFARRSVRIDNAIDFEKFSRVVRKPIAGQLVTVGRLSANKNMEGLLNVFAAAHAQRPDLTLTVVGDGALRANLQAQAKALGVDGAIRWPGAVDDDALLDALATAQLFVSATRYEGFGLALLEAMAAGVVPVVNDIEAFRSIVVQHENGFLVDYTDVNKTAKQWLEALALANSQYALISRQAQQRAKTYDWSIAIEKFEAVYAASIKESKT